MRASVKRPGWLLLSSGKRVSHNALFWILQIGGWLAFGVMMLGYGLAMGDGDMAAKAASALILSGICLTTAYRYFLGWLRRSPTAPVPLIGASIGVIAFGPAAWFLMQALILNGLSSTTEEQSPGPYIFWPGLTLDMYLYDLFIIFAWVLLYFSVNGWMALMLERRRAEQAQITAQTARLAALQSQLEPHFLFNTLNGISSLIEEGRNHQASAVIARLGEFLRATLRTAGTPEIALADDIALVRCYLDIQYIRFGDRLRFSFDIASQVLNAAVPTLLLQPLVENAVRHGILPRASGGTLTVGARLESESVHIEVVDDGVGLHKSTSSGLGLSNAATRLSALYGAAAELRVRANTTAGVTVSIRLPFQPISRGASVRQLADANE
jgi:hypothetical protein